MFEGSGDVPREALLTHAVQSANERILTAAAEQPAHSGMGTTVVAVVVVDDRAFYTSVGDSRVYLWRGGRLTQLTRDDSWLAETLDGAGEQPQDIGTHPMRHVLTKVVGLRPELNATVSECALAAGDALLLCSDGVHGAVPHELLASMLASQKAVEDVAQNVVRSAMNRGATDNVTAIVARVAGRPDYALRPTASRLSRIDRRLVWQSHEQPPSSGTIERLEIAERLRCLQHTKRIRRFRDRKILCRVSGDDDEHAVRARRLCEAGRWNGDIEGRTPLKLLLADLVAIA